MKTNTRVETQQNVKSHITETSHLQPNIIEKTEKLSQILGKPQLSNDNAEELKVNNHTSSKASLKNLKKGGVLAAYKRKLLV